MVVGVMDANSLSTVSSDQPEQLESFEAVLDVNKRVQHAKEIGDYYRFLSLNYQDHLREEDLYRATGGEEGSPWPEHPFPLERLILQDDPDFNR